MELGDVSVFVKVVQAGSFTEAARRLGAPKSTVSSKVSSLERRLGVTLLQRTTRSLRLTDEGELFFQTCARALNDIDAAEALAAKGQKSPQGKIKVTAPNNTGRMLSGFLKTFMTQYPEISIEFILTNRRVDLIGEGVDVAIRAGEMEDSSLIAKRVAATHWALFASPAYLKRAGTPTEPKHLVNHECLLYTMPNYEQLDLVHGKQKTTVKVRGRLSADDLPTLQEMALAGLGIIHVPTFLCRDDVAAKRLMPVLPGWSTILSPIYLVYPAQKFQHPKIRVFIEEMAKLLRDIYASADEICGAE